MVTIGFVDHDLQGWQTIDDAEGVALAMPTATSSTLYLEELRVLSGEGSLALLALPMFDATGRGDPVAIREQDGAVLRAPVADGVEPLELVELPRGTRGIGGVWVPRGHALILRNPQCCLIQATVKQYRTTAQVVQLT